MRNADSPARDSDFRLPTSDFPQRRAASGFTLIELFVAAVLAVIVILAIGQVDVSRVRLAQEVRRRTQMEPAFALAHMARSLQQADRLVLLNPTSVQFRRFVGDPTAAGALDVPANYVWQQYRLVGADLQLYNSAGCALSQTFAAVNSLDLQQVDESPWPPGGETAPAAPRDTNVLEIIIGGRYHTEVVLRAGAYADPATGVAGLTGPAVSPPPGTC